MFDFLDDLRRQDVIPAGHHAIQFIRQWAAASARAGQLVVMGGLPPFQLEVANRIVNAIETREGKSVLAIPQSKIAEYVISVGQKLQDLSSRDFHTDAATGKRLLDEMRHEVR